MEEFDDIVNIDVDKIRIVNVYVRKNVYKYLEVPEENYKKACEIIQGGKYE